MHLLPLPPLLDLLPLLPLPSTAHLQPHGHEAVQAAAEVEHEAAGAVVNVEGGKLTKALDHHLHLWHAQHRWL